MNNKIIFILLLVILASVAGVAFVGRREQNAPSVISSTSATNSMISLSVPAHTSCLANDEYVDYPLNKKYPEYLKAAQVPVVISVRDKSTKGVRFSFTIENVPPDESEQLELHRCGIYILREFQQGTTWSRELWRYDYQGKGNRLLVLLQTKNAEIVKTEPQFYAYFFIDPAEKYLALERGTWGSPDQAMIVKSLASPDMPDVFTVTGQNILKAAPALSNNRDAGPIGWSGDGQYVWGVSSDVDFGRTAYFRINIQNKNAIEVFPAPDDAIHLNRPNIDTGYIFYVYGPPFAGIPEVTQQISTEWKQAGRKEALFLYNLFTKKKALIASSNDPYWNFQERWISSTQFQYTPPSGATTTYTISQ